MCLRAFFFCCVFCFVLFLVFEVLYTRKKYFDHSCPHAASMDPLGDAESMEQSVLLLDLVVTSEAPPLPETTTDNAHVVVAGDQHVVPEPPHHSITVPCNDKYLRGTLPMEDERLVLLVGVAHIDQKQQQLK